MRKTILTTIFPSGVAFGRNPAGETLRVSPSGVAPSTVALRVILLASLLGLFFLPRFALAATNVYYSVGQNATDHKTGSPTVTIDSGVATFSVAQTGITTGVGDRVTYGGAIAYIASKASSDMTQWNLVTAIGVAPSATTTAPVTSIIHEYTSLSSAEAGAFDASHMATSSLEAAPIGGDFILNIPCYYDTGADTAAVTISGWTTDATHYINIYTPYNTSTEINQTQRHSGRWDTTRYRLQNTAQVINVQAGYVKILGLQIYSTTNSGRGAIWLTTSGSNLTVAYSILRGANLTGSNYVDGIQCYQATSPGTNYFYNNIIYDFIANSGGGISIWQNGTYYIYNNTIFNTKYGIQWQQGSYGPNAVIVLKNNISTDVTTTCFYKSGATAWGTGTDYNLSSDTSAPGDNSKISQDVAFADEASDNFHLSAADSGAMDYGTDLSTDPDGAISFTTDIDNETRTGTWDIGADEYVSGEAPPPTLSTCWYSGTGNWSVRGADHCYATTSTYVNGEFNLTNGDFGCADGVIISATRFNFGVPTEMEASCIATHQ